MKDKLYLYCKGNKEQKCAEYGDTWMYVNTSRSGWDDVLHGMRFRIVYAEFDSVSDEIIKCAMERLNSEYFAQYGDANGDYYLSESVAPKNTAYEIVLDPNGERLHFIHK